MDLFLTFALATITQLGIAGLGLFISLKPQKPKRHRLFLGIFLLLGIFAVAINSFQTYRANVAQSQLIAQNQQLKNQISDIGGAVAASKPAQFEFLFRPDPVWMRKPGEPFGVTEIFKNISGTIAQDARMTAGITVTTDARMEHSDQDVFSNFRTDAISRQQRYAGADREPGAGIWGKAVPMGGDLEQFFHKSKSRTAIMYVLGYLTWRDGSGVMGHYDACKFVRLVAGEVNADPLEWHDCHL
jgi:hypothetical protein